MLLSDFLFLCQQTQTQQQSHKKKQKQRDNDIADSIDSAAQQEAARNLRWMVESMMLQQQQQQNVSVAAAASIRRHQFEAVRVGVAEFHLDRDEKYHQHHHEHGDDAADWTRDTLRTYLLPDDDKQKCAYLNSASFFDDAVAEMIRSKIQDADGGDIEKAYVALCSGFDRAEDEEDDNKDDSHPLALQHCLRLAGAATRGSVAGMQRVLDAHFSGSVAAASERFEKTLGDDLALAHFAAQSGSVDALEFLLEHSSAEVSPMLLAFACRGASRECFDLCHERFPDLKAASTMMSPLCVAAEVGCPEIVEAILASSSSSSSFGSFSPLFLAAKNGHSAVVKILLEHGSVEDSAEQQLSPLHVAAMNGHADTVELLLLHHLGHTPRDEDSETSRELGPQQQQQQTEPRLGKTALHYAAAFDRADVIDRMFASSKTKQAARDPTDNNGGTPLFDAARTGATAAAAALISHGAARNLANGDGHNPLHEAVLNHRVGVARVLLKNGADIDTLSLGAGRSPLHLAASRGSEAMVRTLLKYWKRQQQTQQAQKAQSPKKKNKKKADDDDDDEGTSESNSNSNSNILATADAAKGRTALHFAVLGQHLRVVQLLRRHGASEAVEDSSGASPLHIACQMDCAPIVRCLVAKSPSATPAAATPAAPKHASPSPDREPAASSEDDEKKKTHSAPTSLASLSALNQAVATGDASIVRAVLGSAAAMICNENIVAALMIVVEKNFPNLVDVLLREFKSEDDGTDQQQQQQQQQQPSIPRNSNANNSNQRFRSPSPAIRLPGGGGGTGAGAGTGAGSQMRAPSQQSQAHSHHHFTPRVALFRSSVPNWAGGVAGLTHTKRRAITPALERGVILGFTAVVEKLLTHGASAEGSDECRSDDASTPLREAVRADNAEMVTLLVERGRAQFDRMSNVAGGGGGGGGGGGAGFIPSSPSIRSLAMSASRGGGGGGGGVGGRGASVNDANANANVVQDRVPFQSAIFGDKPRMAALLIRLGAAFDRCDHNDRRPLHVAAGNGSEALVRVLLDAGADVHRPDTYGRTPLHEAAFNGHCGVVRLLCAHGASVERVDNNGCGILQQAFDNGHTETAAALIWGCFVRSAVPASLAGGGGGSQAQAHSHAPRMLEACLRGDADVVSECLAHRDEVSPDVTAAGGWSALHIACASTADHHHQHQNAPDNDADASSNAKKKKKPSPTPPPSAAARIAKLLLDAGASVNRLDRVGRMPLHEAARSGNAAVAALLLSRGALSDSPDEHGATPISEASERGHVDVVVTLIKLGKPALHDWGHHFTPLHQAASRGHTKIVAAFVDDGGCFVDVPDGSGRTPMTLAAMEGHVETVKYLLAKKANINGVSAASQKKKSSSFVSSSSSASPRRGGLASPSMSGDFVDVGAYFGSPLASPSSATDSHLLHSNTPLQYACYYGHVRVVDVLLHAGADPDGGLPENSFVKTALYFAASQGHGECVAALLQTKKCSALRVTETFATPLHAAALNGSAAIVDALVAYGISLDATTVAGWTALHLAAKSGHAKVVETLLFRHHAAPDHLDREGRSMLRDAAKNGHTAVLLLLLKSPRTVVDVRTYDGRGPLHDAAFAGHIDAVTVLVHARAMLNRRDALGYTPVFLAAAAGHLEILQLLLSAGADFENPSNLLQTPLHAASAAGRFNVVEFIISKYVHDSEEGSSKGFEIVNRPDRGGKTPVYAAATNGRLDVLLALLDAGGDPRAATCTGSRPIHAASANGNYAVADVLLACGADADVVSRIGITPLHVAAQGGHASVCQLLLDNGAKPNRSDKYGRTAVFFAVVHNHAAVLDLLLDLLVGDDDQKTTPADIGIDRKSCTGTTALHVAAATGNVSFVRKLLAAGAFPEPPDNSRATPLHEVMRTRYDERTRKLKPAHQDVARILVEAGCCVDACDYAEESPFEIAEMTRVSRVIRGPPLPPPHQNQQVPTLIEPVDDEIVLMMRERHSASRAKMEVMKVRWDALANCCCGCRVGSEAPRGSPDLMPSVSETI